MAGIYLHDLLLKSMQEKLNLVKYFHLIKRHLEEAGIDFHTQLLHSYFSLDICGMQVVLCSKIFGVELDLNDSIL